MTHSAPTPTDANTLRGFESESGAVGVGQSRSAAAGPSGPQATPCEAAAGSVLPSTPFSYSEDFHIEDAQTNMLTNRGGLQPEILISYANYRLATQTGRAAMVTRFMSPNTSVCPRRPFQVTDSLAVNSCLAAGSIRDSNSSASAAPPTPSL